MPGRHETPSDLILDKLSAMVGQLVSSMGHFNRMLQELIDSPDEVVNENQNREDPPSDEVVPSSNL